MARAAVDRNVCPGERETGGGVIERSAGPGCGRMTSRAIMGEVRGRVVRICRALVISLMTLIAIGIGEVEIIVHVA